MWFPRSDYASRLRKGEQKKLNDALVTCLHCSVVQECLAYAISIDARFGIWGGMTQDDRAELTGKRLR
jgi:hypothetical protein